jgi:hypothetical protein
LHRRKLSRVHRSLHRSRERSIQAENSSATIKPKTRQGSTLVPMRKELCRTAGSRARREMGITPSGEWKPHLEAASHRRAMPASNS